MAEVTLRDRARGCLVGGAVGDALGYAVEFDRWSEIQKVYGAEGIREYELDAQRGVAVVSDDTQMTLFTANGLLLSEARGKRPAEGWIYTAYLDWLRTQQRTRLAEKVCWLNELPELNALRAPGHTCLQALGSGRMGWVDEPINNSKGCGGVMRVAPVAIYGFNKGWELEKVDRLGAAAAAITHGHSLGYMSAAALVDVIYRILDGETVEDAVYISANYMEELYADDPHMPELVKGMRLALDLAEDTLRTDRQCLGLLGEGWVGEEALFVAIYCAAKYADDFDKALTVAVNHDGDSDSTGAVCGNILGARWGYDALPEKWKTNLELRDAILEIADDLCATDRSDAWLKKYAE